MGSRIERLRLRKRNQWLRGNEVIEQLTESSGTGEGTAAATGV
jgi:hypothetical protein